MLIVAFVIFALTSGQGYGYGGRSLSAALIAFSLFLAAMLGFAAGGAPEQVSSIAGPGAGWLLGVGLFLVFLFYTLGTGTASFARLGAMAVFIFLPLLVLASAQGSDLGAWQDFSTLAAIWATVKFGPSHWVWPYPGGRLSYVFTVVVAVNIAIAGFLLLRRTRGVGYSLGWGSGWTVRILGALVLFACVAIPVGLRLHFIVYAPRFAEWKNFLPLSVAILCFTAWPEELLFRGLLQNLISHATKSGTVGLIGASILFGLSHITNMHFPNWRYVLLATIAGLFYGWTWRKTGSIFASSIVHAGVDILWHFLFATP